MLVISFEFSELKNATQDPEFDAQFKLEIEELVQRIETGEIKWSEKVFKVPLSEEEVLQCIKMMKRRKAGGWDRVTAEHIVHGGQKCVAFFTFVFNSLIRTKYVPLHFKKGVKVPLYKGGGKDPVLRESHRGITLLPVFSKLYESVLLQRTKDWFERSVDKRQGAAQSKCSSLHTSLMLRECITHLTEGGSTAYVALLDTKQAFDCVWIDGLFAQLYKKGIDFRLWWILHSYYTDFKCSVRIGGSLSSWFGIRQGVHQGGVLSAKLYQVFIDSLLEMLMSQGSYCMFNDMTCHVLAYADDITLVNLSIHGLQKNLDLVYSHSQKWRYKHHTGKSQVLAFGKSQNKGIHLTLGGNKIDVFHSAKHMGVILGRDNDHINERILKGKRATSAIQSLSKSGDVMNPIIGSKMYWAVSMPSMLYGAEIWDLMDSDIYKFEKAHRQMAKSIQGVPTHIADGACLATLGWVSVESWVDRRRLIFLWNTLDLQMENLYKQCVLKRLCQLRTWRSDVQPKGPVHKMYETCHKYGLQDILHNMMDSGVMMGKAEWKRVISNRIMEREYYIWWCSVHLYVSLGIYRAVISGISLCWWWSLANDFPSIRQYCRSVVRVIMGGCVWYKTTQENDDVCIACRLAKDSVEHFLYSCTALNRERLDLLHEASMYVKSNILYNVYIKC